MTDAPSPEDRVSGEGKAKQNPGYEIHGVFYPFPKFPPRVMDPVLVTEITGLTWGAFVEGLEDPERDDDPVIGAGLIGMAIWQRHETWSRDRVLREMSKLDMGAIELVGVEEDSPLDEKDETDDADPPPTPESDAPSSTSPETSSATQDSPSESTTQDDSGHPDSGTGSPE